MHKGQILIVLASLLASALAVGFLDAKWQTWKSKYDKKYDTVEEEMLRRERWEFNWKRIVEHNKKADQGIRSYRMAMNHFADRTSNELKSMACFKVPTMRPKSLSRYSSGSHQSAPLQVDWRDKKCVTDVKDQGSYCGSCWAFAAVGALESRYCLKTKELFEMSEQELVDCDHGNGGCCGGFPYDAYRFIFDHGIMASNKYKYKGRSGECRFKNKNAVPMNMSKYYQLTGEDNMAVAVGNDGPITVGFGVDEDFFHYSEGIYDGGCAGYPNHAIIIVGYGTEEHEDYWIIKNSWGHYWGEGGFGKIRRNADVCSIGEMGAVIDLV